MSGLDIKQRKGVSMLEMLDYIESKGYDYHIMKCFTRIWKKNDPNTAKRFTGHPDESVKKAYEYIRGDYNG